MNLDLLQIILILWLIERTFVIRPRYKLAFVSHSYWNYGKLQKRGSWSIQLLCQKEIGQSYTLQGGGILIYFDHYVIPRIKR
jgi:hypothetical protein